MSPDLPRHLRLFRGRLEPSNSAMFFDAMVEDCDRVVGLELYIDRPSPGPVGFSVTNDDPDKLVIWKETSPLG